jgi:hypothetical protein
MTALYIVRHWAQLRPWMEVPRSWRALRVERARLVMMRTWSCQLSWWSKKMPRYRTVLDASTRYSRAREGSASQMWEGRCWRA